MKILIVDDHEVVRLGLTSLLEQYPNFRVVGEAADAAQALQLVEETRPDIVIMDIRLNGNGPSGIDTCREICSCYPGVRVLVLTSYGDDELLVEAIMAGAKGYVLKQVGNNELIRAIEAIGRGESLLDPVVTGRLLDKMRRPSIAARQDSSVVLTLQERKVLALIAQGKTNRQIATAISLSEKTVRNYVSSIFSKLGLSNRAEAAVYATKQGKALLEPRQ